ncbi:acyltransferase family protein [Aeromicrobium phragmitis]|uniref:acyltransferase family protein n=1 Tax=Aeromicrobium phragmitis TaxID=2478914 RepID=UPI00140BCDD3|nr:acyltransferase [Aeromicrobium phragmitis]
MPEPQTTPRLRSLDGLRGLAALVVVVHHAVLTIPALATPYFAPYEATTEGSPAWWLSYTPLHLVWAGGEAVVVFFVLSGLVLGLKARSPRFDWAGYFPERLARLYLPVAGAVAFGVAVAAAFPRTADGSLGPWIAHRPPAPTVTGVLHDLTLVFGPSRLISPLWSLQWEVIFSVLLPLYMVAAVALRRSPLLLAALCIAASGVGYYAGDAWLIYLPMFGVGIALSELVTTTPSTSGRARWGWTAAALFGLLLISSRWSLAPILAPSAGTTALTGVLVVLGSGILVAAAVHARPLVRMLELRPVLWLGGISFSLYLIHEPIIIAAAELLGPDRGPYVLPIALAVSIPAAAVFFRLVERPSHRFAKRVGVWFRTESARQGEPMRRSDERVESPRQRA